MISEALSSLGYTEFVVRGETYEGIEWIIKPDIIPSKEEVLARVEELPVIKQTELEAKIAQKSVILERLGLTEEELKMVLS